MEKEELKEFTARVEQCLMEACGVDELEVDEDDDWPINVRGVFVYVQACAEPEPHAHLFTRIATGVSEEALVEINQLNMAMPWAKILRSDDGGVFLSQRVPPAAVNASVLDHTLEAIAKYARDCGPLLESVYAGQDEPEPKTTPPLVTSLPDNGIFVFGSGKAANHKGGAARLARKQFGAERGVAEGLRGSSYAIPTTAGFGVLEPAVARLIRFAGEHPELDFYVTRLGCGHAGLDEATVAALFAGTPDNVIKPEGW